LYIGLSNAPAADAAWATKRARAMGALAAGTGEGVFPLYGIDPQKLKFSHRRFFLPKIFNGISGLPPISAGDCTP